MVVYYEGLSDAEEELLSEAVEKVICPDNSDESEHNCRLSAILWANVESGRKARETPNHS